MKRLMIGLLLSFVLLGPAQAAEHFDAVVVGSGGGGLGAATTLAGAGKKVLLLEQHDRFGGYMTAFERGDYRFEVSLHAMDGLTPEGHLYPFFKKYGVFDRVRFTRLDPLYRSIYPDRTLSVPADRKEYEKRLIAAFPHEKRGIERLFKKFVDIHRQSEIGQGTFSPSWARRFWTYLGAPFRLTDLLAWMNRPLSALLDEYIDDPQAKGTIAQLWGYLGMPPERLSAVYFVSMWGSYHRHGGWYPIGGSQAISDALAHYVATHGGVVRTNARVTKIIVEEERVRGVELADGTRYETDAVVSNASVPATIHQLVGDEHWPEAYVAKIDKLEVSLSLAQLYLGIRDRSVLAPLAGTHSTFVNGSYDPMVEYRKMQDSDIDEMSYVMVDYGASDPGCAPAGGSVLVVTLPLQYDYQNRWRRDEGYDQYLALKQEVSDRLLDRVEKILPGLRGQIEVAEMGTPLTMERYTLNPQGAIYGFAMTPEQSLVKRVAIETPIEGLYFAGAWTFPGAGQSASLNSGHFAAELILHKAE